MGALTGLPRSLLWLPLSPERSGGQSTQEARPPMSETVENRYFSA